MTDKMTTAQETALARVPPKDPSRLRFSNDDKNLILDTCMGGATAEEAGPLIAIAELRGLNPLLGECHFVKQWDSLRGRDIWSIRISIDTMRARAEETGQYAGQDEPQYEYSDDNKDIPVLARVRVYRHDWTRPCVAVARYDEYVQTNKDGKPNKMWTKMSHNQLAKCAEALALRKAFPKQLSKLYTAEEMAQMENDRPAMAVKYDQTTGEIRQGPSVQESKPPKEIQMLERALYLESVILAAKTIEDLKGAWKIANIELKSGIIGIEQHANLGILKDRKKSELESVQKSAPPPEWPTEEG